jgi:uncharacterized Zn finger protein
MAKTAAEITKGAFQRALGRTAAVHYVGTTTGGFAVYSVDSSRDADSAYTVTVRGEHYRCTCPSELRPACWHRAAVAMVRASRRGFGLPADGHSAEDERAAAA